MGKKGMLRSTFVLIGLFLLTSCGSIKQETGSFEAQLTTENVAVVVEQKIPEIEEESYEQTESAAESTEEIKSVELVMVGDILLHTRVSDSGLQPDGSYQYDHLFANVKEKVEQADLALVNQEVILGGTELGLSGYPCFNGAYEVGDSLVDAGFDVILHATNHALDKGKKGLLNCIHFWKEQYPEIGVLGIYETQEEADDVYFVTVNGIRIAILNYTYGTNGIALPKDMPYAVSVWDKSKIQKDVEKAKEQADFIIACPHWGTEYVLEETPDQREKAQFLADLGVDLIIGTHPHVIEPVEWITAADGTQTLCYYSIGNFINATAGTGNGTAKRMVGAMADVTITQTEDDVMITEYGVEPLVSHIGQGSRMTTYFLSDYTQELAEENEIKKQDSSFSLLYCIDLCKQVYGMVF